MPRYMTRQGAEKIQEEIDFLWMTERPEIVDSVREAAEMGDRSENAAYIYGKKRLREIDSRLRYLRRKLQGVVVIDPADQVHVDHVQFGAVVTVVDDDDNEKTWRLVDKEESEPKRGRISIQSPIGGALMGKRVGDYVQVKLPKGVMGYELTGLRYGPGEP